MQIGHPCILYFASRRLLFVILIATVMIVSSRMGISARTLLIRSRATPVVSTSKLNTHAFVGLYRDDLWDST